MLRLKEFAGEVEVAKVNSGIMNIGDMVCHLLKEIVFYGSGFGWNTSSNEFEEIYILFPYTELTHGLTSSGYIANLKIMLCAEIRYQQRIAKIFKPIKKFSWNIDVTDNEEAFILILRKM